MTPLSFAFSVIVFSPSDIHTPENALAQIRVAGGVEAILRLIEFEVSRDGLARALLGMVEHVAVRRLCPHCRIARLVAPEEAEVLSASPSAQSGKLRSAKSAEMDSWDAGCFMDYGL